MRYVTTHHFLQRAFYCSSQTTWKEEKATIVVPWYKGINILISLHRHHASTNSFLIYSRTEHRACSEYLLCEGFTGPQCFSQDKKSVKERRNLHISTNFRDGCRIFETDSPQTHTTLHNPTHARTHATTHSLQTKDAKKGAEKLWHLLELRVLKDWCQLALSMILRDLWAQTASDW